MRTARLTLLTLGFLSFDFRLAPGAQLIEGLVNIRFQADPRVFAVMAAINAGGFDIDASSLEQNPARRLARAHLSRVSPELLTRLQKFYQARNIELDDVKQQSKYVSFALILQGPPEFKLEVKSNRLPPDVHDLVGFELLVKELWEQGALQSLWEKVLPYYAQEVESYRPLIRGMILDSLRYMRTDARVALDREVIFIPDLLNAYGIVNARNVEPVYILVAGPSRTNRRPTTAVRHEYLHFMIDPLIVKYSGSLPPREPFLKMVRGLPHRLARYENDLPLMVSESLIQVLELRLDRLEDAPKTEAIIEGYEKGLILAPELIHGIDFENEKGRAETIRQLKTQLQPAAATAPQPQPSNDLRGLLSSGNQLLLERRFSQAKEVLERVLEQDAENPSAMFGLAQISAQEQDFGRALDLYGRTANQSGAEPWIRAWSLVRRGNIYQFQGDTTQARQEWTRVHQLQGDLKGAAQAAGKALAETTP
jgi:hypothetical protein